MDPEIGGHVEPIYRIGFAFPLKINQFDFKHRLMKKDAEIDVEFEDGSIRITGTTSKLNLESRWLMKVKNVFQVCAPNFQHRTENIEKYKCFLC